MAMEMTPYERQAWKDVEQWREKQTKVRKLLPVPVKRQLERAGDAAAATWNKVPYNDELEQALFKAVQGGYDAVNDVAVSSIDRNRILEKFQRVDPSISQLADVQRAELAVVDALMPSLTARYAATSASTGAASGAVAGGGTAAAGAGAAAGGVGAAPGVATVMAALAADIVATIALSARLASHYAAYHGFDTRKEEERAVMLSVIGVASIRDTVAKQQAMAQVRQLSMMVARRATWKELNEEALVKLLQRLFGALSGRLTKRKLAQAIPVAGAAIGGGLNYSLVRGVGSAAENLYRERFLTTKYDIQVEEIVPESWDDVDVVDGELIEELGDDDDDGKGWTDGPFDS